MTAENLLIDYADFFGFFILCMPFILYLGIPIGFGQAIKFQYKLANARQPYRCHMCGLHQPSDRIATCINCNRMFCMYPPGNSPKDQWTGCVYSVLTVIGLIILCVGTAVSILGGIIFVAGLAISIALPYFIFKQSLLDSCGGSFTDYVEGKYVHGFRCDKCGGAFHSSASISSYSSYNEEQDDVYNNHYNDDDYHDPYDNYYDDDDDDDDGDDGNLWDGWLVKW